MQAAAAKSASKLTVGRELDDGRVGAVGIGHRAIVVAEVGVERLEEGQRADDPFRLVLLVPVEQAIVRREIELAPGEAPDHRVGPRHGHRGALDLHVEGAHGRKNVIFFFFFSL